MSDPRQPRPNKLGDAGFSALILATIAIPAASLVASVAGVDWAYKPGLGLGLVAAGGVLAVINFCLTFLRPLVHRLRHGSPEGLPHQSGLPVVGSLFVLMGSVLGFSHFGTALAGLLVLALDTGGFLWFFAWSWQYSRRDDQ